jgi:hypothetical protein
LRWYIREGWIRKERCGGSLSSLSVLAPRRTGFRRSPTAAVLAAMAAAELAGRIADDTLRDLRENCDTNSDFSE